MAATATTGVSHAGRRVLVTGAARGIGQAIATAYAAQGAIVGLCDLCDDALTPTLDAIHTNGGSAFKHAFDVADFDSVEAGVNALCDKVGGPFDTLINNAGISPKTNGVARKVWELDANEWQQVVGVNLNGVFNLTRVCVPAMRAAGRGWIVNMASVAGKTPNAVVGIHYAATKAAVIGFTKQSAFDLGPDGIRVNAVAPGRIYSEMVRGVPADTNADVVAMTPLGRMGLTSEVADVAVYLTSEMSSFVTGQTVDVAGGLGMS